MKLANKVALITGGNSGIGFAMGEWLLSRRGRLIVARREYVFSVGHMARRVRPEGTRKLSPGFTLGKRK